MKKWLTDFFDDMRYIWDEFVREVNSVTIEGSAWKKEIILR
ncbi:hypothetical protein V5080_22190 [Atlantibacter hermannii]|nr:hypothetical protein [Kluyvera cryocrescens]